MSRLALLVLLVARVGALAPLRTSPRVPSSPGGLGGRSRARGPGLDLQQAVGARIGHRHAKTGLAAEAAGGLGGGGTFPVDGVVELRGIRTRRVAWDDEKREWMYQEISEEELERKNEESGREGGIRGYLKDALVPEGVTEDYFTFTRWRCFQRFISSMVNVFGTQAMLLALGIRTKGALGTTAAISWVLKDALGKVGRIMWAGRMGRQFDNDAKRWRFRSSLFYAMGNGLEIVTYIFPASFLLIATGANCLKQISMLTSSATRSAIYRSFAAEKNNIGEISAKGEAQIAIVDLIGMFTGIMLSKRLGTLKWRICVSYLLLQLVDITAIYNEIRSIVFKGLNFERSSMVIRSYVSSDGSTVYNPSQVAKNERIFRQPKLRHSKVFPQLSQLSLEPKELEAALEPFRHEKCAVVCDRTQAAILVHPDARSPDVFKALLVYCYTMRNLKSGGYMEGAREHRVAKTGGPVALSKEEWPLWSPSEAISMTRSALQEGTEELPVILDRLSEQGWDTDRFMFFVPRRIEWNIAPQP